MAKKSVVQRKFSKLYMDSLKRVKAHMGWERHKAELWFTVANPWFGGASPMEFMFARPEKFVKILDSLIQGEY